MKDNERIEIVEDINGKINYNRIFNENIDRVDVENAEKQIAILEAENADYLAKVEANQAKIDAIKAEIAKAKEVIAIADAKKEAEEKAKLEAEASVNETAIEEGQSVAHAQE